MKAQQYKLQAESMKNQEKREQERESGRINNACEAELINKQPLATKREREAARFPLKADELMTKKPPPRRKREREAARIDYEAEATTKKQRTMREETMTLVQTKTPLACSERISPENVVKPKMMVTSTTTTFSSSKLPDPDRASWLKTRYSDIILKAQRYKREAAGLMKNQETSEKKEETARTEYEPEMWEMK